MPGRGGGFFFGRLGNYVWASRRGGVVIPASFFHVGSVILWGGRVGQRLPQGRFGGGQVFVHSGGRLCGGSGPKPGYENCGAAECVWADAHGAPRSKTKTLSKRPTAGRPTRESEPAELNKRKPDGKTERRAQTLTCTDDH